MKEPKIKQVRALEVVPHFHGIWCSIQDGEPFVNEIAMRKWSDDGKQIWFMLESHNFVSAEPDELMRVVEIKPNVSEKTKWFWAEHDAKEMAHRPNACAECGHPLEDR